MLVLPTDLDHLITVAQPAVSPDGCQVAFTVLLNVHGGFSTQYGNRILDEVQMQAPDRGTRFCGATLARAPAVKRSSVGQPPDPLLAGTGG